MQPPKLRSNLRRLAESGHVTEVSFDERRSMSKCALISRLALHDDTTDHDTNRRGRGSSAPWTPPGLQREEDLISVSKQPFLSTKSLIPQADPFTPLSSKSSASPSPAT